MLNLGDAFFQPSPNTDVAGFGKGPVNLRQQHRGNKGIDVRSQLALNLSLSLLVTGDRQAVGGTGLNSSQNEVYCALDVRAIPVSCPQKRQGRDSSVGYVIPS